MSFWGRFSAAFERDSQKKYRDIFLEPHRVDVDYNANSIHAGEAYCRLFLVEMRLAKDVEWFTKRYPVVHSSIRFNYGGEYITVPYIAGPGFLEELNISNLDRVIQCNHVMTPLFPFNSGSIELEAGLFSVAAEDKIEKFIMTLGSFSELLPIPEFSSVLKVAGPVYSGIKSLLDIDGSRLELGYHNTFVEANGGGSNELRAGYFVIISFENEKDNTRIDDKHLCVVNDSLYIGEPGKAKEFLTKDIKPLDGYSYMLFRLERRAEQDWQSLTQINNLVIQAQEAVVQGKYEQVRDNILPALRVAIFRSPDVARNDKKPMVLRIESVLKEWGLEGAMALVRPSLYSIMHHRLPTIDAKTDADLTELEALLTTEK